MRFTFTPNIKTVGKLEIPVRDTHEIKNEPMIFSGDPNFAHHQGGPLTKEILRKVLKDEMYLAVAMFANENDFHTVIDTRVTMTMPGMYPSIPGWHCDDVPRGKSHGQPVLHGINPFVQHFMVILSDQEDAVSCTEFVTEPFEVDADLANVWGSVDRAVERDKPKTGFLSQGEIIRFNQEAIHRASITKTAGWRYFFRASVTHRKPANEIRKQVQVYASANGW
jgi:hypothetical protein